MKIRLDQIGDEPYTWTVEETISSSDLDRAELLAVSPVTWEGEITRLDEGFLLRAHLGYEQTLACQRCLRPVTEAVDEDLELLVLPHDPGAEEEERELEERDLGVVVVDGEELDLGPVLEEQIQLAVPMSPLCRVDCAGLCPTCGADLNQGPCGCAEQPSDPRWAALAALRDSFPGGHDG
jgi:uncharacterized protein